MDAIDDLNKLETLADMQKKGYFTKENAEKIRRAREKFLQELKQKKQEKPKS